VLVVGAAGGVGSLAVQYAKVAGAHVTAVASTQGQAFLAALAPDRAIDYRRSDWKALPERFDIVFDCSGTSTFPECRRLLSPGGAYVHSLPNAALYGWSWWLRLTARERCMPVMERPNLADLETLVGLAAAGRLRSVVTRVGRPEDVPALQREMEGGHSHGKLVVRFAPDPA
jgi:NADPH:quinone reductase-like Zn-dependent oxidoreductase